MQRFLSLTALGLGLALGAAHAASPSTVTVPAAANAAPAGNPQAPQKFRSKTRAKPQRKIKICHVDASGKKGDERTASLSACLKN